MNGQAVQEEFCEGIFATVFNVFNEINGHVLNSYSTEHSTDTVELAT